MADSHLLCMQDLIESHWGPPRGRRLSIGSHGPSAGSTAPSKLAKAGRDEPEGLPTSQAAKSQQTSIQPCSSSAATEANVGVADAAPGKSSEPGDAAPMDIDQSANMNTPPQAGRSGVSGPPQSGGVSANAAKVGDGQIGSHENPSAEDRSLSVAEPAAPKDSQLQPVTPSPALPARGLHALPITPALEHLSGEPSDSSQNSTAGRQMQDACMVRPRQSFTGMC